MTAQQANSSADTDRLERLRHSAAHIMAEAVSLLFPEVELGIGPSIADGFYYDFGLPRSLTTEDLGAIEAKMNEIDASTAPFLREETSREAAREILKSQPFKIELIDEMEDDTAVIYRHGSFVDLCRGPHVDTTGEVTAFKLLNVAGAYWRGDERRPMLQRIYGTAFETREDLESHLEKLEEAAKRDHRKLGKTLDLFSIHEEAGPGLIFWHRGLLAE